LAIWVAINRSAMDVWGVCWARRAAEPGGSVAR